MSLLDFIAAAGEELVGLRVLRAGRGSADNVAAVRRLSTRFAWATLSSALTLGVCWAVTRLLAGEPVARIAAVGTYVALATALFSALGWAYSRVALFGATPRRERDA